MQNHIDHDDFNEKNKDLLEQIRKESIQLEEDAVKCKKEWDNIDRWASRDDDDNNQCYFDNWQPYEPVIDFERFWQAKKHGKI